MKLTIKLKRGYDTKIICDSPENDGNKVVVLGNYSKSDYHSTEIVSVYGIAPTVRENHGQVFAVEEWEN